MSNFPQNTQAASPHPLRLDYIPGGLIKLSGALTTNVPPETWGQLAAPGYLPPEGELTIDLANLKELDLNGSAQLLEISNRLTQAGIQLKLVNLPSQFEAIFELAREALAEPMGSLPPKDSFFAEIGHHVIALKDDTKTLLLFTGELVSELGKALRTPRQIPWSDVLFQAEKAGVDAVPIVSLVSFLVGLIIAFQAAMMLKMFGAEIYVANLIGISVVRELGPIIAAIVLAGRSGSAFSAELGAMKAAEEVDAITTMGLSPVRELALPRVLSAIITTPLVTLIASFVGIVGGNVVLLLMGYSVTAYWEAAVSQISLSTFYICIFKSFLFGLTVSAVGCQRGLAAGDGPGAVGEATTSGVVTNIVLIVVLDSLLAVIFYVYNI